MVAQMGMSERIGPMFLEHKSEHPFLGARIASDSGLSDATVHEIELEARRLLNEALARATDVIAGERPVIERLVEALIDREMRDSADLAEVLAPAPPASGPRSEAPATAVAS
jgi:cell division protease FtsH